ncbi:hypothetical protein [Chitinophaga nivalis]|uniref:Uncharacterized protein n=1 Tax=Chitinophaga nivalis TaxID=2991709 RepID=A0ABT3IGK9_9BACT|nr:hypothetical protein [Chitinophaga nivalis]MCW3467214.1 hypothetical protein [Chitinophaga nivalis]MCW3483094.1 hypothetical protein [Chitinophaga nivalis]
MKLKYPIIILSLLFSVYGCSKVEYTKIDNPAYLRVFNNLNYKITLGNKDQEQPFLTMLIDPVTDASGMPLSAAITGDFLDKRDPYAPPYPSHAGSSNSYKNPEYPGKENVLVGPVLNGFDLSSWAQIPAGKHRIMFMYRPMNNTPFFSLEERLKKKVLVDTLIELGSREVYTLHILQKNYKTKETGMLLRQENFHKQALSDSMVYVNFYNMSAEGFAEAPNDKKDDNYEAGYLAKGIKDEMNIWFSSFTKDDLRNAIPGFYHRFLMTVRRNNTSAAVSPYFSFPLFADPKSNRIHTTAWQRFNLMAPGMNPENNPYNDGNSETFNDYALITCYGNGTKPAFEGASCVLPNMIVNIHSGRNNPQSFATVNTIEIVNGSAYLTTVQRKYPTPIY